MAKQLFFQSAAATTHRGVNDAKLAGAASWWQPLLLAETRGASATTATGASVAGTTVGIEFVNGALALEWLSEPLSADFTISGSISLNLWGLESTMNDNTAINAVIDKIDGATGAVTQIAKSARVTELGTTNAVNFFTVTPTSTACKRGDRLRVRPFIDDAGVAMIVGTTTFSYNGPTALAAGDSYVQFTEDLTFEAAGNPIGWIRQNVRAATVTFGDGAGVAKLAQSFVVPAASLVQVGLAFYKEATPTDNIVVEIQTDAGGDPSGTAVGTVATIPAASVSTDPLTTPEVLYPAAISLTASATYWIVVYRSGAIDAVNRYALVLSAGVAGTFGTQYKRFDGTAWIPTAATRSFATSLGFSDLVSTYYLTDTAETINPGSATEKKALTTRGSGSVNAVTNTAAGPTAGIQTTASAGGTAVEWYTPPLNAVTLGGKAKVNIRALESNAAANASLKAEIAVTATDGTGAAVWGVADVESDNTLGGELGTTDAAKVAWVAGDDVSVTAGQRLRFRIYLDDPAIGPLVTGNTVTVTYNGTTAAAAGDTYVTLPVTVTEQAGVTITKKPRIISTSVPAMRAALR